MNYKLSVIIPIYKNVDKLERCLESLSKQKYVTNQYEVIIIQDGIVYNIAKLIKKYKLFINIIKNIKLNKNMGVSYARNIGIKNASGDVLIFLDNDIIASNRLIYEHLLAHVKNPSKNIAVQGNVSWDHKRNKSYFQKWLEKSSIHINFQGIENNKEISYLNFNSSNCSFKKQYLLKNGLFNEQFKIYYEDLELAYRLKKKGLKIIFNKKAIGYHNYITNLKDYKKRMFAVGKSAYLLFKMYPELTNKIAKTNPTLTDVFRFYLDPFLYKITKILCLDKITYRYYSTELYRSFLKGYNSTGPS